MKFIGKLTLEQKNILYDLMRSSKSFKVRRRAHAILLSSKKFKIDQLAAIFDVDRDTISDWLQRWEIRGVSGLNDAARSGRPRKKKQKESSK